jgi:putative holliday junction resolvase
LATSNKFILNRIYKHLIPDNIDDFRVLTSSSKKKSHLLGLDIGKIKCGIAISDYNHHTAIPLEIVATNFLDSYLKSFYSKVDVVGLIIGLPLNLMGNFGASSINICSIVNEMADFINSTSSPIWLHDERYTTTASYSDFKYKSKNYTKKVVDDLCAMKILQEYLDLWK